MIALLTGFLLLLAVPVFAQSVAVPVHNHTAGISTASGAVQQLPARFRSFLELINDSSVAIYCTVDDTNAVSGHGIALSASTGTYNRAKYDVRVPRGSVRCVSASGGGNRLIILEGQ